MSAHLVTSKVAGGTASQSTHQASIAFSLGIGIGGAVVLLAVGRRLLSWVFLLRITGLGVLWELLGWCLARVGLLSVGSVATCQSTVSKQRGRIFAGANKLTLAVAGRTGHMALGSGRAGSRRAGADRSPVAVVRRSSRQPSPAAGADTEVAGSPAADSLGRSRAEEVRATRTGARRTGWTSIAAGSPAGCSRGRTCRVWRRCVRRGGGGW